MTSLPAALARKTLVAAPHRVDLSGRTVAARGPAENATTAQVLAQAIAQELARGRAGARAGPQERVGRGVTIEAPTQVRAGANGNAGVNGKVIADLIVVLIVVLAAGRNVRASGVARC
jgi:hypothetical protein